MSVPMRNGILQKAQESHLRIQKTKLRLRTSYWWPSIVKQAEELVQNWYTCTQASKSLKLGLSPTKEKLPLPSMAWERVAIDIKGPIYHLPASERYAIVLNDLHSIWPEV